MEPRRGLRWIRIPNCTNVDLYEYWEYTTHSNTIKAQRPSKRHIPQKTVPFDAGEELENFKPHVKTEPGPRTTGIKIP